MFCLLRKTKITVILLTYLRLDSGKSSCHYGDEFTYVIEGEVEVLLNETEVYRLSTGDVIYYPSHIPHKWKNVGETMARVLSTGTPASF